MKKVLLASFVIFTVIVFSATACGFHNPTRLSAANSSNGNSEQTHSLGEKYWQDDGCLYEYVNLSIPTIFCRSVADADSRVYNVFYRGKGADEVLFQISLDPQQTENGKFFVWKDPDFGRWKRCLATNCDGFEVLQSSNWVNPSRMAEYMTGGNMTQQAAKQLATSKAPLSAQWKKYQSNLVDVGVILGGEKSTQAQEFIHKKQAQNAQLQDAVDSQKPAQDTVSWTEQQRFLNSLQFELIGT